VAQKSSRVVKDRDFMSVSSVSTSLPVQPVVSSQPKPPAASDNNRNDDATTAVPMRAPLPPGQGTRIDQLV
jgi:hypothetical protein